MSVQTNVSLPVSFDMAFGLKGALVLSCTTTSGSPTISITNTNIPSAGYASGTGIPAGTTFTYTAGTVTLSNNATVSGTNNITFSYYPGTYYFAIFTSAPNQAGGGTEVSGGSYARVPVANNTTNFPATSAQNKTNGTAITFPASTAAWGTIVAWGVYDSASGGNLWYQGAITSITLNNGDTMNFPVGFFDLTF